MEHSILILTHNPLHMTYTMSKPKPVQSCPPAPADTTNDEEKTREPQILNPRKKAILAKLFMHNPQFAETFFKARIGMSLLPFLFRLFLNVSSFFPLILAVWGARLTYRRRGYDPILCPSSAYFNHAGGGVKVDDGTKSRWNLDTLVEIL